MFPELGIGTAHFGAGFIGYEHPFDAGLCGVALSFPDGDLGFELLLGCDAPVQALRSGFGARINVSDGSKPALTAPKYHFRYSPRSGHCSPAVFSLRHGIDDLCPCHGSDRIRRLRSANSRPRRQTKPAGSVRCRSISETGLPSPFATRSSARPGLCSRPAFRSACVEARIYPRRRPRRPLLCRRPFRLPFLLLRSS